MPENETESTPAEPQSGLWERLVATSVDVRLPLQVAAFGLAITAVVSFANVWLAGALGAGSLLLAILTVRRAPPDAIGVGASDGKWHPVAAEAPAPPPTARPASPEPTNLDVLQQVYFRHLYHWDGDKVWGLRHQFSARYFLDLMEASLVPEDLLVLRDALVQEIKRSADPARYDAAIGAKRGNSLLTVAVAHELDLSPVLVKERPLFERPLEGLHKDRPNAFLLDDIASDGEFLVACVERARSRQISVDRAFVLVNRKEGDARAALHEIGVTLYATHEMSDDDLAEIAHRGRRGR